ncbi:MAG: DUF2284 domain-containing protein [Promethearchaeota archaeon]
MQRKVIPEIERRWSNVSYKRRNPLPEKKDRPPSPIRRKADLEVFEELNKRSNDIIQKVISNAKSNSTGHAKLITTEKIVIDPRVRWKCRIPVCFGYGMSLNCPPHSPTTEEMREIVANYKHGILVCFYPPVENHVFPGFLTRAAGDVNLLNEMVTRIEAEATYLGYYLAMGFSGGPCLGCGFISPEYVVDVAKGKKLPRCPALEGQMCSQYLRARPSLEACGVDVFATVTNCGEKTPYVINPEHPAKSVPFCAWHGIVLII